MTPSYDASGFELERAADSDTRSELNRSLKQFSKKLLGKRADFDVLSKQMRDLNAEIELLSNVTGSLEKALASETEVPELDCNRMAAYR